ncbi:MAG: hypothetical protein QMC67_00315 [Candidatus Wallbacteria bacterium]
MNEIINEIKNIIFTKFPFLNISVEKIEETNEFFILIDDKNTYNSDSFLTLITEINMSFLWPKNIDNIYFSYESETTNNVISFTSSIKNDLNYSFNQSDITICPDVPYNYNKIPEAA